MTAPPTRQTWPTSSQERAGKTRREYTLIPAQQLGEAPHFFLVCRVWILLF